MNQKVNETKACPTMLLVCAPVTKKDKLEKQIAPETLLAQISAENGRPEQSEGIPGELCWSIFFFGDLVFMGRGPHVRSRLPGKAFLFECLPFSSLLPPLLPTYARLLVFFNR